MNVEWTPEQRVLRRGALELGGRGLNEGLRERDRRSEFNHRGWQQCAAFGILGLPMPVELGGAGADAMTTVGVLEHLGLGCRDHGLIFSMNAQLWTVQMPLLEFGDERQKSRWLPELMSGVRVGASAMTEPGAGSDAYSLVTKAERRGERYVLNGAKSFVSNAGVADLYVVYATLDRSRGASAISAFLVSSGHKGLSVSQAHEKMGLRTSPMADLVLEDCEVDVCDRLGGEGEGAQIFTHAMTWERSCILASAVGSMQWLLDKSLEYAKDRRQFGQSIGKFQLVAERIVDMKLQLDASRAALYRAAMVRDRQRSAYLEASLAKLQISESWVKCAEHALQIHGGYGYMQECEIERELRDALGSRIYSGTSEIQRGLIASLLGL